MEIIRIPGYTEDEKVEIAKRHLITKEVEAHGLRAGEWSITDEALFNLIRYYTREAGVRNLEREIANLTRKAVKEIESGKTTSIVVTAENLGDYAGVRKHRYGEVEGEDQIGVVTRAGLDGSRRRYAADRIRHAARQGPHADHRQTRRCDEGVDRRGAFLCALQGDQLRHQTADLRDQGHPRPRSGRRDNPRTVRPRVPRWPPRSSRSSPVFRCAAMWR